MRLSLPLALAGALSLSAACGAGQKGNSNTTARQPTDPKAVPTATLPAVLPSPIPAGTVTEGAITGQASSGPTTYVIKSGDTMAAIAQKVGVPLSLLQSYNSDVNPSRLIVGQELKVPPLPSATPTPTAAPLRPATTIAQSSATAARSSTPSATSTPSGAATTAPIGGSQTYTVQSGDTGCQIATKFNVSLQELANANGLTTAALTSLRVGQDLKIPPSTGAQRGC